MNDGSSLLVHIIGTVGLFSKKVKDDVYPTKEEGILTKIHVAKLVGRTKAQTQSQLDSTPIKSGCDWNCQNWVGDALKGISGKGWISSEARSSAIDKMVDVVLDAPEE